METLTLRVDIAAAKRIFLFKKLKNLGSEGKGRPKKKKEKGTEKNVKWDQNFTFKKLKSFGPNDNKENRKTKLF